MNETICQQCGKPQKDSYGWPTHLMNDCDDCERTICADCVAECDYGGGDGNSLTQWVCFPCLESRANRRAA